MRSETKCSVKKICIYAAFRVSQLPKYDRFQKGVASTAILQRQLENKDKNGNYHEYKIIITTIQKLDVFIRKSKGQAGISNRYRKGTLKSVTY